MCVCCSVSFDNTKICHSTITNLHDTSLPSKILILPLSSQALIASNHCLFSILILLAFSRISYKWNHRVHILLYLAPFTQHNCSEIHLCGCTYEWFISFYCFVLFHCMGLPVFVINSPVDWHFGYFQLLQRQQLRAFMDKCLCGCTLSFLLGKDLGGEWQFLW